MQGTRTKLDPRICKPYRSRREPTDPEELKARNERRKQLALSWLENPINEIYVRDGDFAIGDGNERWAGLIQLDVKEFWASVLPATTTDAELDDLSLLTDFHKTALTPFEQATVAKRRLDSSGMKRGELAAKLNISPGHLSKLLSVFDCPPEYLAPAESGLIGVEDWYVGSKSPKPEATLEVALGKGGREAVRQSAREKKPKVAAVRISKIKVPLTSGVTIQAVGQEISLEECAESLKEALKAVNQAIAKSLNAKTAQAYWKDLAAAGN